MKIDFQSKRAISCTPGSTSKYLINFFPKTLLHDSQLEHFYTLDEHEILPDEYSSKTL